MGQQEIIFAIKEREESNIWGWYAKHEKWYESWFIDAYNWKERAHGVLWLNSEIDCQSYWKLKK